MALGFAISRFATGEPPSNNPPDTLAGIEARLLGGNHSGAADDAYRLNDMFLMPVQRNNRERARYESLLRTAGSSQLVDSLRRTVDDHMRRRGSLAAAYLRSTNVSHDYEQMIALVRAHVERTCVVHLRVGDVLDAAKAVAFQYSISDAEAARRMASASYVPAVFERGFPYGFPLYVYGNLTASLARARVATVVLVAGAHVALPSYRHSARYVQAVAAVFRDAGFETRLRLGQHPDEDFAYMAQARCFVSGGGGFSQTIAELVRRNGGATHLTRPDEAAGAKAAAAAGGRAAGCVAPAPTSAAGSNLWCRWTVCCGCDIKEHRTRCTRPP